MAAEVRLAQPPRKRADGMRLPGRGAGEEVVGSAAAGEEGRTEEGVAGGAKVAVPEKVSAKKALVPAKAAPRKAPAHAKLAAPRKASTASATAKVTGGPVAVKESPATRVAPPPSLGKKARRSAPKKASTAKVPAEIKVAATKKERDGRAHVGQCPRRWRRRRRRVPAPAGTGDSKVPSNDGKRESWTSAGQRSRSSGHEVTPAGSGSGRPGRISEWR